MSTPVLIAVDWGSSNLRAMLLNAAGECLQVAQQASGILTQPSSAFAEVLDAHIGSWRIAYPQVPILLFGMIGSRGGWYEVPYVRCPADVHAIAKNLFPVPGYADGHAWIVPGLSGLTPAETADVMRGEEVQLIGALFAESNSEETVLAILPGTHSKWAMVRAGHIEHFATAISGELFATLTQYGSLAPLLEANSVFNAAEFRTGLVNAKNSGGLTHHIFSLRGAALVGGIDGAQAQQRLSGLLIGHEISGMLSLFSPSTRIAIIGNRTLTNCYREALKAWQLEASLHAGEIAAATGAMAIARAANIILTGN